MPLRNSGMCALCKNKSDIGNMLIHTSLNSFVFCACIVGDGGGKGQGRGSKKLFMWLSFRFLTALLAATLILIFKFK